MRALAGLAARRGLPAARELTLGVAVLVLAGSVLALAGLAPPVNCPGSRGSDPGRIGSGSGRTGRCRCSSRVDWFDPRSLVHPGSPVRARALVRAGSALPILGLVPIRTLVARHSEPPAYRGRLDRISGGTHRFAQATVRMRDPRPVRMLRNRFGLGAGRLTSESAKTSPTGALGAVRQRCEADTAPPDREHPERGRAMRRQRQDRPCRAVTSVA